MDFTGQTVWITGASSGIGQGLVLALDRLGARLVLSGRNVAALEQTRHVCSRPDDHMALPLDLAQSNTFSALTQQVIARFGQIDILVNNGGISQRALVREASPESERTLMEVDYFGPIALTKAVLPHLLARRAGRIVVISSVMGYVGTPGRSSYAAAKHALHGYFDSLRAEVWRDNVKVTLVCPGYVKTAVSANALRGDGSKHGQTDATHQRGISVERCVNAIIKGIARDREEIAVGGFEVSAIYLKRYLPWLFSRIARHMKFVAK